MYIIYIYMYIIHNIYVHYQIISICEMYPDTRTV